MSPSERPPVVQFGAFAFDPRAGELRKHDRKLKIQGQPLEILAMLLERPGEMVTREELQKKLWPEDTFVDFEHSLNAAVKRLRDAMGDSADAPQYVETLARRGYRFIAEVNGQSQPREGRIEQKPGSDAVRPPAGSVAVLPFANLSADSENEYFADGITEDVIAHLAKIRSLKVISRTSVMAFKRRERSLREIGEKLGAATVVEGSIRRAGNRVRIVAQLVDAATDEHIWAETYDRDLTDIFAIQSDVALNIATALRAQLSPDERARVVRRPTENFEAYELYLRGHSWFCRFTQEGFRRSLIDCEAAIALDPCFALAWASIAQTHAESCVNGFACSSPEDTIRSARAAAARALEIDAQLAEAHSISAFVRFVFDFDWLGAEREFLTAIELSPGSARAHEHYGLLCGALERYDDALREVQRARELDPLLVQTHVATTLLRAGRIDEALEEAQRSLRDTPGASRAHSSLGWALIFLGDHVAGIKSLERASALSPSSTLFLSQLGQAYGITGDVEGARKIVQQLQDRAVHEFVSPYHFAYVHAGLAEADKAIDWLERAFEQRSGGIYGIKGSFLFRNLRSHPRFKSLLQKMNLT